MFGISRPQIGPSEPILATLMACHAIKRCPFGLLFAVLDSPCVQLADIEATRDCSQSTESCMDEKQRKPRNSSIQNSHTTTNRVHWTNTLAMVSTMAHYCITKEYDQLTWILQMREPNRHSSVAPFPASTLPRPCTPHASSGSIVATWQHWTPLPLYIVMFDRYNARHVRGLF